MPSSRPDPTSTFLLTDIEGSVALWHRHPDEMFDAVAAHGRLLVDAVATAGGEVFKDTGDGLWARFDDSGAAVLAAGEAQRALADHRWPDGLPHLLVRMALHRGPALTRGDDYCGQTVNATARLIGLAHGGQVLATAEVVADARSISSYGFIDLGRHRLRDLPDRLHIHQVTHPDLPTAFGELVSLSDVGRLPVPPTMFHGRAQEMTYLGDLLERCRLITLAGPPGVGKSRLAIEAANALRHRFPQGTELVELSSVAPDQLLASVAATLGVYRSTADSLETAVVQAFGGRGVLLVLDNAEHLVDDLGRLVDALLRSPSSSRILVTTTTSLRVAGEHTYEVRPLDIGSPSPEDRDDPGVLDIGPAVAMFGERAASVDAAFVLDRRTLPIVRELCTELDGVPLAIELLASRAAARATFELETELNRLLDLVGGRASQAGQASLRDVIASSVELLPDPAQHLLVELSIFTAPFTAGAVKAVCPTSAGDEDATQELLDLLHAHSLVARQPTELAVRYALLNPIRRYAAERLGEAGHVDRLRARHATHFIERALAASTGVRRRDELIWSEELEGMLPDLDDVVVWLRGSGDTRPALELTNALWDYGHNRMHEYVWNWASDLADEGDEGDPLMAPVLGIAALGAWQRADHTTAELLAERSLAVEHELGLGPSLPTRLVLLDIAGYRDPDAAFGPDITAIAEELFTASTATGEPYWEVNAYVVAALGLAMAGATEDAIAYGRAGLRRAREADNPSTLSWGLYAAGVANAAADPDYAEALVDEALRIARGVDNRWCETMSLTLLATLRRRVEGGRAAATLLTGLLDRWQRAANEAQQWHTVRESSLALHDAGEETIAIALALAAQQAELAMPLLPEDRDRLTTMVESASSDRSRGAVKARLRGELMRLDEAVLEARTALDDVLRPPPDRPPDDGRGSR